MISLVLKRQNSVDGNLIKKMIYAATKRGMKETEILLGDYIENNKKNFKYEDCLAILALMNESDPDILNWILLKTPVPNKYEHHSAIKSLMAYWSTRANHNK